MKENYSEENRWVIMAQIIPWSEFMDMMTVNLYRARTNYAFNLHETAKVAQLMEQGATLAEIERQVMEEDLFQLRSRTSRRRALNTILKRLQSVESAYIKLLATANLETRRLTNLFLILRSDRLLQEFIHEVLRDKLQHFDYRLQPMDLRTFFAQKREQNPTLAQWSDLTYQKTASNKT